MHLNHVGRALSALGVSTYIAQIILDMPSFVFGIKKEAELYCASSKIGLSMDPQAIGVINQLKYTFIEDGKVNLSFNEISDFIVLLCKNNVLHQIRNMEDEEGVAWTIALLSKAYISASISSISYDELFVACFVKYYA